MGINDLWPFLDNNGCRHVMSLNELHSLVKSDVTRVGIDLMYWFIRYYKSSWSVLTGRRVYNLDSIVNDCIGVVVGFGRRFENDRFVPVFCMDGDRSPNKVATLSRRREENKRHLRTLSLYHGCKLACGDEKKHLIEHLSFLDEFMYIMEGSEAEPVEVSSGMVESEIKRLEEMIPTASFMRPDTKDKLIAALLGNGFAVCRAQSISEGEKLCSILCRTGYCRAVCSGDCDVIPLGAACVIRGIERENAIVYFHNDILSRIKLTSNQLLSACIMAGSDFSDGVHGFAMVKASRKVVENDFSLHKLNTELCDSIRLDTCIEALSISELDIAIVSRELKFLS